MDIARDPYSGSSRKLVIAFDIGTTFSGAAYALLDPGEVPRVQSVTRYLNNPNPGDSKVPSISYYDQEGNFRGVENGVDFQDDDTFLKMRWWKLVLSPTELSDEMEEQMSVELPKGKDIIDVFADFMGYLFDSTEALFKESEPNGKLRWKTISNEIELVLSHPNGWGGPQQAQLRTAAIRAGIVPDTPAGHSRVNFVTEGEASFCFCATQTQAGQELEAGEKVLIIDAGGGTIDISTYKVLDDWPLQVEELYEPKCLFQGGELVTMRAAEMVEEMLGDSRLNTSENLEAFAERFDGGVKRVFSNKQTPQYIKFCSLRDNDSERGIKAGRITLSGAQVSEFFEPSIQSTVDTIRDNFKKRLTVNSFAFLVGGFATSPWLSKQLEKRLSDLGFRFCKPDMQTNKAVAIGAVSYYIDSFVTGRISKFTREHKTYIDAEGDKLVPDCFTTMLSRGTKVLEDREIRFSLCCVTEDAPKRQISKSVLRYTGTRSDPGWTDTKTDKFETLCEVQANLSSAPYVKKRGRGGTICYKRSFDVILLVGLTELKAQIGWIDSATGEEERSAAVVVYDDPSEET